MENIRMLVVMMVLTCASGAFSRLTEFIPSGDEYSLDQVNRTTILDTNIIEHKNKLRDKYSLTHDQEQKIREKLDVLEKEKAAEERMTKHLNELGALDAALKCNVEMLKQISDEIRELKKLKSSKSRKNVLKQVKEEIERLEKQRGKLDDVVEELSRKKDAAQLKIKK